MNDQADSRLAVTWESSFLLLPLLPPEEVKIQYQRWSMGSTGNASRCIILDWRAEGRAYVCTGTYRR